MIDTQQIEEIVNKLETLYEELNTIADDIEGLEAKQHTQSIANNVYDSASELQKLLTDKFDE